MKQNKKGKSDKRFSKIVNHIVQKASPSDDKQNAMAVQDEADAIDQEGKPRKPKVRDLDTGWNK